MAGKLQEQEKRSLPAGRQARRAREERGVRGERGEKSERKAMMQQWYNTGPMIVTQKLSKEELAPLLIRHKEFIKVVVDLEQGILAAGGALHADDEAVLLEDGSAQKDLWGANYYPQTGEIEYRSMINIRPKDGNCNQEIKSEDIKAAVRRIVLQLLGQ